MKEDPKIRAEFELWVTGYGKTPNTAARSIYDGGYVRTQTFTAWLAWQAAWEVSAAIQAQETERAWSHVPEPGRFR